MGSNLRRLFTVKQEDVGSSFLRLIWAVDGKLINPYLGTVKQIDVGKRLYVDNKGQVYIESAQQREERLARENKA